jgi:hypothetical protein
MGRTPDERQGASKKRSVDSKTPSAPAKRGSGSPRALTFLVRIWPQLNGDSSDNVWRGYVADLSGANIRYFDDGDTLARILKEAAGAWFPGVGQARETED